MAPLANICDFDLSALEDLELVRLVQEEDDPQAAEALLVRHLPWLNREVAWTVGRRGLWREEDVEEAQVDAALAAVRALRDFDGDRGCPLPAFLRPRIVNCLRNYVRHVRSTERLYDRSPAAAAVFRGRTEDGPGAFPRRPLADGQDDPAALAERHEALEALEQVLDEWGPTARDLWKGLAAGVSLRALAPELGLTYKQARLLKEQLWAAILVRLCPFFD